MRNAHRTGPPLYGPNGYYATVAAEARELSTHPSCDDILVAFGLVDPVDWPQLDPKSSPSSGEVAEVRRILAGGPS